MFRVLAVALVFVMSPACRAGQPTITHLNAPDPGGCYVEVFDREQFSGQRDFINGPAKYGRLTELPFGARWHNRIRSFRVGPAATFTGWASPNFDGVSVRVGPERTQRRLSEAFSGRVASIEIACRNASGDP